MLTVAILIVLGLRIVLSFGSGSPKALRDESGAEVPASEPPPDDALGWIRGALTVLFLVLLLVRLTILIVGLWRHGLQAQSHGIKPGSAAWNKKIAQPALDKKRNERCPEVRDHIERYGSQYGMKAFECPYWSAAKKECFLATRDWAEADRCAELPDDWQPKPRPAP